MNYKQVDLVLCVKNIQFLCKQYGIKGADYKKKLGVCYESMKKIKKGARKINLFQIDSISKYFGLTMQEIILDDVEKVHFVKLIKNFQSKNK